MLSSKYSFSKNEKVKSKKEMSRIFKDGIFFYSESISVVFVKSLDANQQKHKLAISVPKKIFKLAVQRNRVKRLIREAYRLNKHILYKNSNALLDTNNIVFIYKCRKILTFENIQNDVVKLLEKIIK